MPDYGQNSNIAKWKGMFFGPLRKVQLQAHPTLNVQDEALDYIETLIIELLYQICECQPHTVDDVEDRVLKTFPHPIYKWAISDAQAATERGKKKNPLVFPAEKVHPVMQKDILGYKVDYPVTLYIVAVMEYISADILKLAGNYVKNIRHVEITRQDIKVALYADKVLMDMFHKEDMETVEESLNREENLTYDEVVREMLIAESQYIRDLNMIIKVFKAPFEEAKDIFSQKDIDLIFSNISAVYEFSVTFLGLLEAAVETADEGKPPAIGECFEEMAEGAEFEVYATYALEQTALASKQYRHLGIGGKLLELLARPNVSERLLSKGPGFKAAVQYCLPKLVMLPVHHCLHYFDLIKLLIKTSPDDFEKESLGQAQSAMDPLKGTLNRIMSSGGIKKREDKFTRAQRRKSDAIRSPVFVMKELQKNIDAWEGREISQCCTELIKEGILGKIHLNKKVTERYVFLLDGLLVCCKQNTRHSLTGPTPEYRLKEKYSMRKMEVNDLEDTEDVKYAFEVVDRDQAKAVLTCKTEEDKNEWMAALMSIYMKSTFDRMLDQILQEEEKAIPLRIPSPDEYCFAVEDMADNIVFEEGQGKTNIAPVIRGGALIKLVAHLTHHQYADPNFVRTFLTTYRSFCKPRELLDLLITRFEIPEPPPTKEDKLAIERGDPVVREDLKRFRKEYQQPVQLRVLNVLRHWVDNHFYDFERDQELLETLQEFLGLVKGKAMSRWVESINKVVDRKTSDFNSTREITFEKEPPAIEWHTAKEIEKFDILSLHPVEIARQLTLMESALYRAVRPSELVGSVWTKEDIKHLTSPNLLKMIHHTNKITLWFEQSLLEHSNREERVAVLVRIVDILTVFQELNNFNGILEVVSAVNSSPIHRLQHTFSELSTKRTQILEEAKDLTIDHYKKYKEKLRSINPPCVPFLGMYLSNILKIEDGNPDFLPNYPDGIINFSKRRKVAEITGEIQQYQNQPYCLQVETQIREYLESLDPSDGRTDKEMEDFLYKRSLELEPRNKPLLRFPRKTDYNLKSPGSKAGAQSRPQSSLRRSRSQASEIFPLDFFDNTSPGPNSRASSSSWTDVQAAVDWDEQEPDYVNIETIPEKEEPPPGLPPRRDRRTTSLYEERSFPRPLVRAPSASTVLGRVQENWEALPAKPPRPPVHGRTLSQQNSDAPPLPPREPVQTPPPIPPRSRRVSREPMKSPGLNEFSFAEETPNSVAEDAVPEAPPKLPPRTRR